MSRTTRGLELRRFELNMTTMPLIDFWARHPYPGIHPEDAPHIEAGDCVAWSSSAEASRHQADLDDRKSALQRKLHTKLYPQPFVGNIREASVYILFGNPGLSVQDYVDELDTPDYAKQCTANLGGAVTGFGPLLQAAEGTGAQRYWNSTLGSLIRDVGLELGISLEDARSWVLNQVATIEAGAYHSKKFPAAGFAALPSTKAAKSFVDGHVMARVRNGECVVFVWRQAKFWGLPKDHPGVRERFWRMANGRYLLAEERLFMVRKLAEIYRLRGQAPITSR